MKNFNKKDLWTIPNILGYIRILLIPLFTYIYIHATTPKEYYISCAIVLFSSFTDLFDGMIARKFNMVTDLGKILDPVADKLTHAALALCLAFRYPLMRILLVIMIIKEGYMAIMGAITLKKGTMLNGAMWCGKVCTTLLFSGLFILFLFPTLPSLYANILILIMMSSMVYTFIRYIIIYHHMLNKK